MTQELIYTSAPRGLKPGARGFCTVACTQGMSKPLAEQLEALSGYRPIYATGDERAVDNPINYSHSILRISGNEYHVLSRVADAGFDYTQRSNKLAHHVVLNERELTDCGPAALLAAPEFMVQSWTGEPQLIPAGRQAREVPLPEGRCVAWEQATGDAGWGGVLAETALSTGAEPVVVIYRAGFDPLPLVNEALSLLPTSTRWKTTFSTYYTKGSGIDCRWRFMVDGTTEAKVARRMPNARVIDLCGPQRPAEGGELVLAARTGVRSTPPSGEESARHPQERLVQFGTAASAPDSQGVPYAEEVAYGLALPDMPPLSQPSVQIRARQRDSAATRRRLMSWYSAISAVSLLLFGVAATVVYRLTKAREIETAQPAPLQQGPKPTPERSDAPSATSAADLLASKIGGADGKRPSNGSDKGFEQNSTHSPLTETESSHGEIAVEEAPPLDANPETNGFAEFKKSSFLSLPLPTLSGTHPLASLTGLEESRLDFSLLGTTNALQLGNSKTSELTVTRMKGKKGKEGRKGITVRRSPPNEEEMASFWFENGQLMFSWDKNIEHKTKMPAGCLQNCVLEVIYDGDKHQVQLRPQVFIDSTAIAPLFQGDSPIQLLPNGIEMTSRQMNTLQLTIEAASIKKPSNDLLPKDRPSGRDSDSIPCYDRLEFPMDCGGKFDGTVVCVDFWIEVVDREHRSHDMVLNAAVLGPHWTKHTLGTSASVPMKPYSTAFLADAIKGIELEQAEIEGQIDELKKKPTSDKAANVRIEELGRQRDEWKDVLAFCKSADEFLVNLNDATWLKSNLCGRVHVLADKNSVDLAVLGDSASVMTTKAVGAESQK